MRTLMWGSKETVFHAWERARWTPTNGWVADNFHHTQKPNPCILYTHEKKKLLVFFFFIASSCA